MTPTLSEQLQFLRQQAQEEVSQAAAAYRQQDTFVARDVFYATLYKAKQDRILTPEEIADAAEYSRQWMYRLLNRAPAAPLPQEDV